MLHTPAVKILVILPVVLYLLAWAGCTKPSHRQDRTDALKRQSEERVLKQARRDYKKGRDEKVIKDLNRFLSGHTQSPKTIEARLMLAQSYERSGSLQAALDQYTIIAKNAPSKRDRQDAQKRMEELNQRIQTVRAGPKPLEAVRVPFHKFSVIGNDPQALKMLNENGSTTVLIDFGCSEKSIGRSQTAMKTSGGRSQDQLASSVAQVHSHGFRVFAGINLRCLGYWDSRSNDQWLDGAYDPATRKIRASRYFDIFHPQYQKLMGYEIKRLTDSEIDGVVFLADVPLGMYDGFTPGSVNTFNKIFRTRMTPQTMFLNGRDHGETRSSNGTHDSKSSALGASEFWRWAGWKTRQRLLVQQNLMEQIREHKPAVVFGLEIHPESIQDPVEALTQYSEDFLEANQKGFSFFLVTPRSTHILQSNPLPSNTNELDDFLNESRTLVDRMMLVIQSPTRIWLSMPWGPSGLQTISPNSDRTRHLQKVSRVYDLNTFLDK